MSTRTFTEIYAWHRISKGTKLREGYHHCHHCPVSTVTSHHHTSSRLGTTQPHRNHQLLLILYSIYLRSISHLKFTTLLTTFCFCSRWWQDAAVVDTDESGGISGFLRAFEGATLPGGTLRPALMGIGSEGWNNECPDVSVISSVFELPTYEPHITKLLHNTKLPERTLTHRDLTFYQQNTRRFGKLRNRRQTSSHFDLDRWSVRSSRRTKCVQSNFAFFSCQVVHLLLFAIIQPKVKNARGVRRKTVPYFLLRSVDWTIFCKFLQSFSNRKGVGERFPKKNAFMWAFAAALMKVSAKFWASHTPVTHFRGSVSSTTVLCRTCHTHAVTHMPHPHTQLRTGHTRCVRVFACVRVTACVYGRCVCVVGV